MTSLKLTKPQEDALAGAVYRGDGTWWIYPVGAGGYRVARFLVEAELAYQPIGMQTAFALTRAGAVERERIVAAREKQKAIEEKRSPEALRARLAEIERENGGERR